MATQRITITNSAGETNYVDIVIPEQAGTYNLQFTDSNGNIIDAGNFVVEENERTYNLTFGLSSGSTLNVGSFTTQAKGAKTVLTINNTTGAEATTTLKVGVKQSDEPVIVKLNEVEVTQFVFDPSVTLQTGSVVLTVPTGVSQVSLEGGSFGFDALLSTVLTASGSEAESPNYIDNTAITEISFGTNCTGVGGGASTGTGAFANAQITTLNIPNGWTTVTGFGDCTNLTSVTLPNSVKTVGGFIGCTSLINIPLPEGVETIADSAFAQCAAITSIQFPASLKTIGQTAFQQCTGLTSVFIPRTVEKIYNQAFYYCSNLSTFTIEAYSMLKVWGANVLQNTQVAYNVTAQNQKYVSTQNNPYFILADANNATRANPDAQCQILGGNCYFSATNFTSIVIPKSVRSICGSALFSGASTPPTITFESGGNLKGLYGGTIFQTSSASAIRTIAFPETLEVIEGYAPAAATAGAFANSYFTELNFENCNLKKIAAGTFDDSAKNGNIYLGNKLEFAEKIVYSNDTAKTVNLYLNYTESTPVLFDPATMLSSGSSKGTITYNIYTDNSTIKDALLASAAAYTTVNVYHYDGSAWA